MSSLILDFILKDTPGTLIEWDMIYRRIPIKLTFKKKDFRKRPVLLTLLERIVPKL